MVNMSEFGFDVVELARLIKLVEQRGLCELAIEEGDRKIVIRGSSFEAKSAQIVHGLPLITAGAAAGEPVAAGNNGTDVDFCDEIVEDNRIMITTPMVGVFYITPGPDQPNYVEVGDAVSVGQTIGMIEAMKVFSEVPSEYAGTVVEVVATSGALVKPGEPLLYLSVP